MKWENIIKHWQSMAYFYAVWARDARNYGDFASAIYFQNVSADYAKQARETLVNGL